MCLGSIHIHNDFWHNGQWENDQISVNTDEVRTETQCVTFSGITGGFIFSIIGSLFLLGTILVGK